MNPDPMHLTIITCLHIEGNKIVKKGHGEPEHLVAHMVKNKTINDH